MKHIKKLDLNEANKLDEAVAASDYEIVSADFKDIEGLVNDLQKSLKKLGISMYNLPSTEGSDTYGFILSKRKLTKKEINEIDE